MQKTQTAKQVTVKQFDKALATYSSADTDLASKIAELNKAVEKAAAPFNNAIKKLEEKKATSFETVKTYCEQNRDTLFPEDKKSCETPHGVIGFRTGQLKVILADGIKDKDVVESLRKARWAQAVNMVETKYVLDKKALIKLYEEKGVKDHLEKLGVTVDQDETFYIK